MSARKPKKNKKLLFVCLFSKTEKNTNGGPDACVNAGFRAPMMVITLVHVRGWLVKTWLSTLKILISSRSKAFRARGNDMNCGLKLRPAHIKRMTVKLKSIFDTPRKRDFEGLWRLNLSRFLVSFYPLTLNVKTMVKCHDSKESK